MLYQPSSFKKIYGMLGYSFCLAVITPATFANTVNVVKAEDTVINTDVVEPSTASTTVGNAFNPKISVILDGKYSSKAPNNGYQILGQTNLKTESAANETGMQLGESEIVLDATVDQYLDGRLNLSIATDGVSAEEAWIKTRMLPYGLTLKAGQMMSGIAYHNDQHAHMWDFNDLSLPYQAFLSAEGLKDMGVQLTWLPDIDTYTQLGLEIFKGQGEDHFATHQDDSLLASYGISPSTNTAPNISTAFLRVSPNLSGNSTLQLGSWFAYARNSNQIYTNNNDNSVLLQGHQLVTGLNAVYKWDSPQLLGTGDVKIIAELMQTQNSYNKAFTLDNTGLLSNNTVSHQKRQGYSLEGSYGIAPRWLASIRLDALNKSLFQLADEEIVVGGTQRISTALSFAPSEFSRFRAQLSYGKNTASTLTRSLNDTQFMLQYTMSLGTHGAHSF